VIIYKNYQYIQPGDNVILFRKNVRNLICLEIHELYFGIKFTRIIVVSLLITTKNFWLERKAILTYNLEILGKDPEITFFARLTLCFYIFIFSLGALLLLFQNKLLFQEFLMEFLKNIHLPSVYIF
jgi:hypothetical protein